MTTSISLSNYHEASLQDIADQITNHLLSQNKKCMDEKDQCRYRYIGLKCAAGCLISDEEYNEKFEENEWAAIVERLNMRNFNTQKKDRLISEMQSIHDGYPVAMWRSKLIEVYKDHRLTVPEVLNAN